MSRRIATPLATCLAVSMLIGSGGKAWADTGALVAVMPLNAPKLDKETRETIEEGIRTVTADAVRSRGYTVIEGDTTQKYFEGNAINLSRGCEGKCATTTARDLQAAIFITGTGIQAKKQYVLVLKATNAKTRKEVGSLRLAGNTVQALKDQLDADASKLLGGVPDVGPPPPDGNAELEPIVPQTRSRGPIRKPLADNSETSAGSDTSSGSDSPLPPPEPSAASKDKEPASASSEAPATSWPTMDSLVPSARDESLFLDVALIPQTYYWLNSLGQPVEGIRMSAWVNMATQSFLEGKLRMVFSFRYDLDAGALMEKTIDNTLLVPNSYEILAAYIEYDVTHDFHLRIGRQFYTDMADYLAFDGLRVVWKLPAPLQLELYGGVRSSLVVTQGAVGSSLYELDGTSQAELLGTQPVVGAAIRWVGNQRAREEASVGFRESWLMYNASDLLVLNGEMPPNNTLPTAPQVTAQEIVATAARDFDYFYLAGGAAYDLALLRLMRARASLVFPFSKFVPVPFLGHKRQLDIELGYQRYQPTFALDSIWSYFTSYPYDEVAAGMVLHGGPLRIEARVFERVYYAEIYTDTNTVIPYSPGIQYAAGGRAAFSWAITNMDILDAGASYQAGFGGSEVLIDGGVRHRFEIPLEIYGRLSVSNWNETEITTNDGTSFGLVAGATYHLPFGASVALIVEEAIVGAGAAANGMASQLYSSDVPRVYAVVDLTRWL